LPGWPITRTPIIRFAVHFEREQLAQVEIDSPLVEHTLEPQQAEHEAQQHDDGEVGGEEQEDALHESGSPGL
jgi:hypothetical protein